MLLINMEMNFGNIYMKKARCLNDLGPDLQNRGKWV